MKCPLCGRETTLSYETGKMYCRVCGWGTGQPVSVPERIRTRRRTVRATNLTHVVLLWLAAAGVAAIAAWIVFWVVRIRATDEHVLIFAGCIAGYGVLGYFIQPAVDADGSSWFFGGFFDRDEEGLWCVVLSFALFPGRLIALAFVHTFCLIRQGLTRGQGPSPRGDLRDGEAAN